MEKAEKTSKSDFDPEDCSSGSFSDSAPIAVSGGRGFGESRHVKVPWEIAALCSPPRNADLSEGNLAQWKRALLTAFARLGDDGLEEEETLSLLNPKAKRSARKREIPFVKLATDLVKNGLIEWEENPRRLRISEAGLHEAKQL